MSEKAERLAIARRKLREHQSKKSEDSTTLGTSAVFQNENQNVINTETTTKIKNSIETTEDLDTVKQSSTTSASLNENSSLVQPESANNVIQMLITDKAALTSEISKFKNLCKDRELEIEEMQARYNVVNNRMEVLEREYLEQQKRNEELNDRLSKMEKINNAKDKTVVEQNDYIVELKNSLSKEKQKNTELDQNLKEKINELELNKVRFNQISDEVSLNSDNRVETLIQTKFMYEQQIRDLQAMVQQLGTDKDQANLQYQNYVQHLKNEVASLSEKNNQLIEENSKFNSREKDLISHISSLEKQIQQTIASQEDNRKRGTSYDGEVVKLQTLIEKLEKEQIVYHEKIKSLEDELLQLKETNSENLKIIEKLEQSQETCFDSALDGNKLLAAIESDKVAASRALIQNAELKQQLEELQRKFVQLTNDKLELRDRLDSEEHANKEIKANYKTIESQLLELNQKWHFKDEEMIRLSHENNELIKENENYKLLISSASENLNEKIPSNDNQTRDENNIYKTNHDENTKNEDCTTHDHDNCLAVENKQHELSDADEPNLRNENVDNDVGAKTLLNFEATEKLQVRFTKLMGEVADLTDEKQRLEHLVLQLQGETETIGEYIALYQTQRRMLKQREYEKAAQFQKLMQERKELKEKISTLNSLVSHLGIDIESTVDEKEKTIIEVGDINKQNIEPIVQSSDLRDMESKELINKIQNIILEIKENTKDIPTPHTVDHCSCCLGKLETI